MSKVQDDETLETKTIGYYLSKKGNMKFIFMFVFSSLILLAGIGYMSFGIHTSVKYNNEITPLNPYYAVKLTVNTVNTESKFNISSRRNIQYFDEMYKQHKEICKDLNYSFGQCDNYTYYIELEYIYYLDFPIYKTNVPLDWKMYEQMNLKDWTKVENDFGLIQKKVGDVFGYGLGLTFLFVCGLLIIVGWLSVLL